MDDAYWSEKVHVPASAWVAAGARGQPIVPTEAAVKAHVPGLQDSMGDSLPPGHEHGDAGKRQANRDRKAARKRRFQSDMDELRSLRQGQGHNKRPSGAGGKDAGGKGKGKTRDQAGTHSPQVLSAWPP